MPPFVPNTLPARGPLSAPSPTCPPSRFAAKTSMPAPIYFPSVSFSTRWPREPCRSAPKVPVCSSAAAAQATKPFARDWRFLAPAAVLLTALGTGALYWRSTKVHALTEKDSIVLADFVNTTGDAVFDDTLKQALAVKLQESPFLNVVPEHPVREALRLMSRSPDE